MDKASREQQRASAREDALDAILTVADHLGLPAGEAPTIAQFDQAAIEMGLGWSGARVTRVWERWRLAVEVFKGEREARSFVGRDFHADQGRSRKNLEEPLRGVKLWLRSRPSQKTIAAYDEFAKTHNANRAPADKRLRSSASVKAALHLRWPSVISVARGEVSLTKAREGRAGSTPTQGHHGGDSWLARSCQVPQAFGVGGAEGIQGEPPFPDSRCRDRGTSRLALRGREAVQAGPRVSEAIQVRTPILVYGRARAKNPLEALP